MALDLVSGGSGFEVEAGEYALMVVMTHPEAPVLSNSLDAPLNGASRVDEIYDRLVTAIAIGEYLPGARLPAERELAANLQVARMTVREALSRLVEQGMLVKARGRGGGSFVREQWTAISSASVHRTLSARWEALRDTCEAMMRLSGAVALAAAEKRTDDDVTVLRARLEDYRLAESGSAAQKADERLHIAIADAAHNVTLKRMLAELESQVSIAAPSHLWGFPEGQREMEQRALVDHQNLVDAICEKRFPDAGAIGLAHAGIDMELLEAALHRAGAP